MIDIVGLKFLAEEYRTQVETLLGNERYVTTRQEVALVSLEKCYTGLKGELSPQQAEQEVNLQDDIKRIQALLGKLRGERSGFDTFKA